MLRSQLAALDNPEAYKNEIWTRVQRVNIDAPEQVVVNKIRGDIEQTLTDLLDEEQFDDEGPEPLFDADAFEEPPVGSLREQFSLSADDMKRYEKIVLDVRKNALDQAAELRKEEEVLVDPAEVNETVVTGELHEAFAKYQERWREDDPLPEARKGKKRLGELSAAEVSAIVESEKVDLLSHDVIAALHNISTGLAGRIIRAAKKDRSFVSLREQKSVSDIELTNTVRQLVGEWDEDEEGMLSLARLRKKLKEESEFDCSVTKLRAIMRGELGLRFKKIKPLVAQTNRLRCVLCRQQYAMTMLEVLASGKRVLNVDESWLS